MEMEVTRVLAFVLDRLGADRRDQAGMATAEMLGNAALGIGALVVIWGVLRTLGVDVVAWMGQQIGVG